MDSESDLGFKLNFKMPTGGLFSFIPTIGRNR
jgi:hypothetical protein